MKYPGDIKQLYEFSAEKPKFLETLADKIREFKADGYYVEVSHGGRIWVDDKWYVCALVVGREWIEVVDEESDPTPARFAKVKQLMEETDEVPRESTEN
jgi:hypothetical protein